MMRPGARTELRKDAVSGRWVLVRNHSLHGAAVGSCPFCPGREAQTPVEIAAYRTNGQPSNSSGWLVRVIPERAPLLQVEGDIYREGLGMFDRVSGRGASEIVIEHPDHQAAWGTLPAGDIERILWMYRDRVTDLYRDPQIRAVLVLRRSRTPAATITHPFSRVIGAPIIFDDIRHELATARHYFVYKHRCLYCDIVHQERQDGVRMVQETRSYLVYCPYGSHRPFETWIVPTTHRHRFENVSADEMADLARTLQDSFRRLQAVQPGLPIEVTIHTSPNEAMRLRDDEWRSLTEDYHWHIEIIPDGGRREMVGGFAVNPVPPEAAAKQLREALR
jgi:UDPglucose--hexose-1-phosphate uridylyltransferase